MLQNCPTLATHESIYQTHELGILDFSYAVEKWCLMHPAADLAVGDHAWRRFRNRADLIAWRSPKLDLTFLLLVAHQQLDISYSQLYFFVCETCDKENRVAKSQRPALLFHCHPRFNPDPVPHRKQPSLLGASILLPRVAPFCMPTLQSHSYYHHQ